MGLFGLFKTKIDEWNSISRHTRKSLDDFKEYFDRLLNKIELFQEIYLKIMDFENMHIFEKDEIKHLRSGIGNSTSPKLYEKYFYFIKRRLKKMNRLLAKEFEAQADEKGELEFVHKKLLKLDSDDEENIFISNNINNFENKLARLESIMYLQLSLVEKNRTEFKRFVGNTQKWADDYGNAGFNSKRYYADIIKNKDQIFAEWKAFREDIGRLESSIKEEITLVVGKEPRDGVANWKVFISNNLKNAEVLSNLANLLKKSSSIVALSKEPKINIYHATENRIVVPLSESRYQKGFYFCIKDKAYATRIKRDIMQNEGSDIFDESAFATFTLSIPESLFEKLALTDSNYGNPKDERSVEAYEYAYYVPVSRYPLFNHYYNEGLIKLN